MCGICDAHILCVKSYITPLTSGIIPDDAAGGGNHSDLSLSEVLAGAGAEDSTFQQLTQSGDLLEGLEFPVDVLSQLPATPPRPAGVPATGLPPPSMVRPAWEQGYYIRVHAEAAPR